MGAATSFSHDVDEPLGLWTASAPAPKRWPDLRALHFEYCSRGDRVPGRLLLPPQGNGPFPVILLQHGRSGSKEAEYIDSAAGPWAQRGAAVATIDFPLHGERASTKLGEKLIASLHGTADRSDHDICIANNPGQILRATVCHRYCRIALQQQRSHRLADDIRPADNNSIKPGKVAAEFVFDHQYAACRRAGYERISGVAGGQFANIDEVEAIDVL